MVQVDQRLKEKENPDVPNKSVERDDESHEHRATNEQSIRYNLHSGKDLGYIRA